MGKHTILWRCIALALTAGGVAFNYFFAKDNILGEITARYRSLFVPADYAFAIWGLIYLSVIIFLAYSLTRPQRGVLSHEGLAKLLTLLSIGGMVWITTYTSLRLALSCGIILLMLATSLVALKSSYVAHTQKNQPYWISFPFALYAGWLTVATISNISIWLKSEGTMEGIMNEQGWANIFLVIAGILGVVVTIRYRAFPYALVIAWAAIGIWMRQSDSMVRSVALIVALVEIVFVVAYLMRGWVTAKRLVNH